MEMERQSSRPPSIESPTVQRRAPSAGSSLADVLDRVLDKGIVIDAWVRVSVVGLELLTVEARVVVASVETYLKYAEAIRNIELASKPRSENAPLKYTETPYAVEGPKRLLADVPERIADAVAPTPKKQLKRAASALPKKLADAPGKLATAVKQAVQSRAEEDEVEPITPRGAVDEEVEVDEDDVADFIADHSEGLRLDELQEHFHASRKRLESVLRHLVQTRRARWDEDVVVPRDS